MKKLNFVLLLIFCVSSGFIFRTESKKLPAVTLSSPEVELYSLIIEYRKSKGLNVIPLSKSLTYVAQLHCKDLYENKPDLAENCNAHSWSEGKKWSGCCYTPDHKAAKCMWQKPAQLTNYHGFGYEIACGSSKPMFSKTDLSAQEALKQWQGSSGHNNVILNAEMWKPLEWNAIGIGMYKNFAVVWFGTEPDPDGEPTLP